METQRDMDQESYAQAVEAAKELQAIIEKAAKAFAERPKVIEALRSSQLEFERYKQSQIALISASVDGTMVPLLHNAMETKLLRQRKDAMKSYLMDVAPDVLQ